MRFIRLAKKNKEVVPESWDAVYEGMVVKKIRERYSLNAELSIHRKRDSNPEEFAEYDAYVEQCKAEVKAMIASLEE